MLLIPPKTNKFYFIDELKRKIYIRVIHELFGGMFYYCEGIDDPKKTYYIYRTNIKIDEQA